MPAQESVSGKVCVMCHADVSHRPRTKDKRGRYFCRECYAKAVRTLRERKVALPRASGAPVPPPAQDDDGGLLLELAEAEATGEALEVQTKPCPSCKQPMRADTVLCMACGFNEQTGQKTAMIAAAPVSHAATSSGAGLAWGEMLRTPWALAGLQLLVCLVLFGLALLNEGLVPVYAVLFGLFALGVGIWTLVAAFQDSATSGILCLVCGVYSLYFVYAKSGNPYLIGCYTINILAQLLLLLALPGGDEYWVGSIRR